MSIFTKRVILNDLTRAVMSNLDDGVINSNLELLHGESLQVEQVSESIRTATTKVVTGYVDLVANSIPTVRMKEIVPKAVLEGLNEIDQDGGKIYDEYMLHVKDKGFSSANIWLIQHLAKKTRKGDLVEVAMNVSNMATVSAETTLTLPVNALPDVNRDEAVSLNTVRNALNHYISETENDLAQKVTEAIDFMDVYHKALNGYPEGSVLEDNMVNKGALGMIAGYVNKFLTDGSSLNKFLEDNVIQGIKRSTVPVALQHRNTEHFISYIEVVERGMEPVSELYTDYTVSVDIPDVDYAFSPTPLKDPEAVLAERKAKMAMIAKVNEEITAGFKPRPGSSESDVIYNTVITALVSSINNFSMVMMEWVLSKERMINDATGTLKGLDTMEWQQYKATKDIIDVFK